MDQRALEIASVRQRINDPDDWCQGRCKLGDKVCLSQAIHDLCTRPTIDFLVSRALDEYKGLVPLNDKHDHETVLRFLDDALTAVG